MRALRFFPLLLIAALLAVALASGARIRPSPVAPAVVSAAGDSSLLFLSLRRPLAFAFLARRA